MMMSLILTVSGVAAACCRWAATGAGWTARPGRIRQRQGVGVGVGVGDIYTYSVYLVWTVVSPRISMYIYIDTCIYVPRHTVYQVWTVVSPIS